MDKWDRAVLVREVIEAMPKKVQPIMKEVATDPLMNDGLWAMMERSPEFSSPTAALLAGISLNPVARREVDRLLEEMWDEDYLALAERRIWPEVIVGGGLHAAIYAAVRVQNGHTPPLVIERGRVGGTFAVTSSPAYYLNSRNRPGELSVPGEKGALNVLPDAPLQPSDIGGAEYQSNDQLAWAIRLSLMMNSALMRGSVRRVRPYYRRNGEVLAVDIDRGFVRARRVLIAMGLGEDIPWEPQPMVNGNSRLLTFSDLMRRMEDRHPLRGMRRVAVIGAGDSGKTAIEALTGQGPSTHWSVASLDWPEQIDWYGVDSGQLTKGNWETCNRSRYKSIGRLLGFRVVPIPEKAGSIWPGYNRILVNEVAYDYAILCVGFRQETPVDVPGTFSNYQPFGDGTRILGQKLSPSEMSPSEIYRIGAGVEVGFSERELKRAYGGIKDNKTALFRWADRTATLAAMLP